LALELRGVGLSSLKIEIDINGNRLPFAYNEILVSVYWR